jgi:anti-anti-sigma factor
MPSAPDDDRPADPPEGTICACEHPTANMYARSYASGSCTVVVVSGEIDLATAEYVAEHLQAATARPAPDVIVDLRPVAFFDCSGLRVLCRAEYRARERGGRLRIVTDQPRIHRLLRAAGLLKRFPPLAEPPPAPPAEG